MLKLLNILIFCVINFSLHAETLLVISSASPSHSSTPLLLKTLEEANKLQSYYQFVAEFKPGAQGVIALQYMDQSPLNRIGTIAPSFVENVNSGQLRESNYLPVAAQGDACWALIANVGNTDKGVSSLELYRGKEIVVGGTGFGNAAHLTSLILADRYGFKVRYVVFKSNFDGLVNMVGDNGVNLVLDRIQNYQQFKAKQEKLQVLGMNCNRRNEAMPEVKTLREQGFDTPMIFNIFVANRRMEEAKRKDIGNILIKAQAALGQQYMLDQSDMLAPQFYKMSVDDFFKQRINLIKQLNEKYAKQIENSR